MRSVEREPTPLADHDMKATALQASHPSWVDTPQLWIRLSIVQNTAGDRVGNQFAKLWIG